MYSGMRRAAGMDSRKLNGKSAVRDEMRQDPGLEIELNQCEQ